MLPPKMYSVETYPFNKQTRYVPTPFVPGKSICSICGQPIEKLSDDKFKAAHEAKWKVHWECREKLIDYMDRITDPGGRRRS